MAADVKMGHALWVDAWRCLQVLKADLHFALTAVPRLLHGADNTSAGLQLGGASTSVVGRGRLGHEEQESIRLLGLCGKVAVQARMRACLSQGCARRGGGGEQSLVGSGTVLQGSAGEQEEGEGFGG